MNISNRKMNYYISVIVMFIASFPTTASFSMTITSVLRIFYLLGFAWAFVVFIIRQYYNKKKLYPVLIMLPWFIFCSMVNTGSSVQRCGFMCVRMFVVIVLTQYMLELDTKKSLKQIGNIWSIYMIIQLISLLTGFMGVTSSQNTSNLANFFFGIRVEINEYIIYSIAFGIFAVFVGGIKEKILTVLSLFSGIYFAIGEWVSTSISGLAIFGIVIVLSSFVKKNKKWGYVGILILIAAVAFPYIMENRFVSWYVVDAMGEDITFNGRTILWAQALEQIKGAQIIYGKGFEPISDLWIIGKYAFVVNHPHNNYIQFYYWYGIIGVIMYIVMYLSLIREMRKSVSNKIRVVYMAAIVANMVMAVFSRNYWYMTAQIFYIYGVNMDLIDKSVGEQVTCKKKRIRIGKRNRVSNEYSNCNCL